MSSAADPVHTLSDLTDWSFPNTALAVVGQPVAHSLSPAMHNAALREFARTDRRFEDWRYFKFDIAPADLPAALALFHAKGFRGLNLTVPHKMLAVPLLESGDAIVQTARAANTLRRTTGGWEGFNTDGYGLGQALREDLDVDLKAADVILLGAGGAARGAAGEFLRQGCRSLWIGNRSAAHREALLADLRKISMPVAVHGFDLAQPPADLPRDAVVINATVLGLKPGDPVPIDLGRLASTVKVFDMIYNPPKTPLLRQAARLGLPQANGLSMLVHQGARALELWTGLRAPTEIMRAAAKTALARI